jgi:hypothetical protein
MQGELPLYPAWVNEIVSLPKRDRIPALKERLMKKCIEGDPKLEEKLSEQARIIRSMAVECKRLQAQLRRYRRWNDDKAKFLSSNDYAVES